MTFLTGELIVGIHILSSISGSKGNPTPKFGHLIECNLFNKMEAILRLFFKKVKIEHIFGSTVRIFMQFVFIVCSSRGLSLYIESKALTIKLRAYSSLSDSNGIRTHNHLVRKRTLNH